MSFRLPRNSVMPVEEVDVRLVDGPHPFELQNAAAIEAGWAAETARNPSLFDGRVVLLSALAFDAGRLAGRCHVIRYATFLHWRRHRDTAGAWHVFAHAALVSRDGALLAVRMGAHTANAGRVYFAAGSFEPQDFRDGLVDLHGNMAREVREETGLSIDDAPRDARHHFISMPTGTVVFRRYYLPIDADAFVERVHAHMATEEQPEIAGPVVIRSAEDLPDSLAPHMRPMIAWHFATPVTAADDRTGA